MRSIIKKSERNKKSGRIFLFIFFSIFAAVGGGMIYPLGIRPIMKTCDAKSWQTVSCKIDSAKVESHSDSDGTTYSIEIEYSYQYEGKHYKGDQYTFTGGSSSGYKGKQKVVNQYKNAINPVCYVNPENPSESVLKRGLHLGLLSALIPLPFAAVGFGGLYWVIFRFNRRNSKLKATCKKWLPGTACKQLPTDSPDNPYEIDSIDDFATANSGLVVLKSVSPLKKLFHAAFFSAFWNAITYTLLFAFIKGHNGLPWFLMIFFGIFITIGLFTAVFVVIRLLMLFNPRPKLMLSTATVKPADPVKMQWQFSGRTSMLNSLCIALVGKEYATYRRGTDTYTDTNTFFQMELFATADPSQIPYGDNFFSIPEEVMHSFDAPNNKIKWEISVTAQIDKWPDLDETFNITVLP